MEAGELNPRPKSLANQPKTTRFARNHGVSAGPLPPAAAPVATILMPLHVRRIFQSGYE